MGVLQTIFAAIFCASAPMSAIDIADSKSSMTEPAFQLGEKTVSSVRGDYKKGKYSQFFKEMDDSFKGADLSGFIQMRKQQVPVQFQEQWEQEIVSLQKQKNGDLMSALSDKDDSIFARKVRSLAGNISTPEQEKAISRLNAFITLAPNKGANEDENTLINIDLEYEYKLAEAQFPKTDVSPQERHDRQLALRMEKMDKMVKASKSFKDHSLKKAVSLAAANLDARLARNLDGADLNALVKAKARPNSETEEKIFAILSSYQGQFNDLLKNLNKSVY